MSYKKTEDLFSRDFMCDKKHKLNTSPKAIPTAILNEIENKGLTLERIEELNANGYDIYKYATQITMHGTCDELSKDGRIGWYKCLSLNKNKSIGIKWIAVDREKKLRIIEMLKECGWSSESNSTELYPMRFKRVENVDEARRVASEWKANIDRIDHSLFYGTSNIYLARCNWGGVYVVCNLVVNGIKECNVNKLIEQVTDMPVAEIEAIRESRLRKEKEDRDRRNAEYERERAKREAEAAVYNEKFVTELLQSHKEVVSNEQPVGTVVAVVKRDYDGKYKLAYYRIEKRTAKPCHEDGSNYCGGENKQKLIKEPCKCFVKVSA